MTEGRVAAEMNKHQSTDTSMRTRQLVATVRQGRRVNISILDEGWFEGYLGGWDNDTYLLLVPQSDKVEKYLIPKNNILAIQLVDERTFREESRFEEMEPIVRPFADRLNNEYPKK